MTDYTIKQLATIARISVRTLHYYDELGLLKPRYRRENKYRYYGVEEAARLQQIMFFRELGFSLDDIGQIMSRTDFDLVQALESHKELLLKKAQRINELIITVAKSIKTLKGESKMEIKEFYEGFNDEEIKRYRDEVRERWGEKTLIDSETRVIGMGKQKFAALQAEGGAIFQAIADSMKKGFESPEVQKLIAKWREWLENFSHYSDEAVLGLGQAYSQDERFARFFEKYDKDLALFLTRAIEYYSRKKK
jgi:DNA-binding transcriptional MerR regulator